MYVLTNLLYLIRLTQLLTHVSNLGCGHCTNMKAAYSSAAAKAAAQKIGVLAAVDATTSPIASKTYGVNGFPTLKYFVNGKLHSDYNGKRTAVVAANGKIKKDEL